MIQESSPMSLEVERRGDVLLVIIHGRMGEIEAQQLQRELLALVDEGSVKLVVDLTDVPFLTSTSLGALMVAHKRVRAKDGYLRVAGAQPLVRQILEITKLIKLFGNYPSAEAALAAE